MTFKLDPRLQQDCIVLDENSERFLLLLNNAHYNWFVLVPKQDRTEWFELTPQEQNKLTEETNQLSSFIKNTLKADKINIATIGNVVAQLHIHIIGRKKTDPAWPGVAWGHPEKRPYQTAELEALKQTLHDTGLL